MGLLGPVLGAGRPFTTHVMFQFFSLCFVCFFNTFKIKLYYIIIFPKHSPTEYHVATEEPGTRFMSWARFILYTIIKQILRYGELNYVFYNKKNVLSSLKTLNYNNLLNKLFISPATRVSCI